MENQEKNNENLEKQNDNNSEENVVQSKNITLRVWEALEKFGIWILEKIHLNFLANFYKEHIEGMRYLICGGLSTVVNIVSYAIGAYAIFVGIQDASLRVTISDTFAFVVALIFAYWVNKTIVFNSKCENIKALIKEITSFTACRLVTQAISLGMMNLAVIISMNDVVMKVIANIVVIILNFVLSKLIIFKKDKKTEEK
ncbi:MAG: GtrA family protein [Clostridia bacterium]|nr:GtrA family protein [Clostridia bacterium]